MTMTTRWVRRQAAAAILLAAASLPSAQACAESVRLVLGGDLTGQGWIFRDRKGTCRIVTAAHNLKSGDRLRAPLAIDATGAEIMTEQPVVPDTDIDIGFLLMRSARACPGQMLPSERINARLAESPLAFIEIVQNRATSKIGLRQRQRSMDEAGGRTLLFDPVNDAPLVQGLSGGAVLDTGGRPLGIAVSRGRDDGRLSAIRLDVVAALLDAKVLPAASADASAVAGWSVLHGRSADTDRGPEYMLERSGRGWHAMTNQGYVAFVLRLKKPQSLSAVSVTFQNQQGGKIHDLQVHASVSGDDTDAQLAGRCEVAAGATAIRCAFRSQPEVRSVRITLRSDLPAFSLGGLVLER